MLATVSKLRSEERKMPEAICCVVVMEMIEAYVPSMRATVLVKEKCLRLFVFFVQTSCIVDVGYSLRSEGS